MNKHLTKLLAKREATAQKMKDLLGIAEADANRALTAEEATAYDALDAEIDALTADIKRTEKQILIDNELDEATRTALNQQTTPAGHTTIPSDIPIKKERYSLFRAVRANVTGDWEEAEYERACSIAIAEELGREPQGLFVPYEIQRDVMATQAGGGFTDDGALVGTDHRDDLFIESLRADSFVVANGARVLTGLVGNIDIPRALGGVSFSFVDEDGNSTDSTGSYDSVAMSPKTITGAVPITRRLLKQSSPAVEALIMDDIRQGVALAIDEVVISGDGTANKPKGIIATTGVNTVPVADAGGIPTFAEVVSFETALAEDNALRGRPVYATTPAIAGATKTTPLDAGSGAMVNTAGKINDYPTIGTTLMPTGKILFGNFADVVIGMWGVMDIVVDTATKVKSGGIVLRVFQDIDVAVRHPQSFAVTA